MGMFGQGRRQADDTTFAPDPNRDPLVDGIDPRLTAPMPKKRGMFGGAGKVLGGIADVMMYGPFAGRARENRQFRRDKHAADLEEAATMREYRAALAKKAGQPQQSNAAKMAGELGLAPGTPQYADFIRHYAFKPTILQVPNASGGIDFTQVDSQGEDEATPDLAPGHVEGGYQFNGGDPADPSSWSKL